MFSPRSSFPFPFFESVVYVQSQNDLQFNIISDPSVQWRDFPQKIGLRKQ